MGHFKSNVRDIEFNLFEVFGTDRTLQNAPFADVDVETARGIIAEVAKLAEGPLAASFVDADRNPPVFDPETYSVTLPESFKKSYKTLFDSEWWRLETLPELGGQLVPRTVVWAVAEQVLGLQPGAAHVHGGRAVRRHPLPQRQRDAEEDGPAHGRPRLGRHDGADRARRRLRRRRRPHQGGRAARRLVAHRGRQALHHLGRAGHDREHRPPRPGPSRGRGRGHQGPVAVRRAEVPLRPRDRRARRAQRRLRHQRRAQDGPQGLDHLRAALRRDRRHPGQGLAGRRRARRHRADVPGHRARPHDGRHQGHRDAVDRLPQRAGLRQDPRAVGRPHPGRRQDRAARRRSSTTPTSAAA